MGPVTKRIGYSEVRRYNSKRFHTCVAVNRLSNALQTRNPSMGPALTLVKVKKKTATERKEAKVAFAK